MALWFAVLGEPLEIRVLADRSGTSTEGPEANRLDRIIESGSQSRKGPGYLLWLILFNQTIDELNRLILRVLDRAVAYLPLNRPRPSPDVPENQSPVMVLSTVPSAFED